MPINSMNAHFVACDLCGRRFYYSRALQPGQVPVLGLYETKQEAKQAAHVGGWTVGRDAFACPLCSPVQNPPPIQV